MLVHIQSQLKSLKRPSLLLQVLFTQIIISWGNIRRAILQGESRVIKLYWNTNTFLLPALLLMSVFNCLQFYVFHIKTVFQKMRNRYQTNTRFFGSNKIDRKVRKGCQYTIKSQLHKALLVSRAFCDESLLLKMFFPWIPFFGGLGNQKPESHNKKMHYILFFISTWTAPDSNQKWFKSVHSIGSKRLKGMSD